MPLNPPREYILTAGELGLAAAQTTLVVLLPILLSEYRPSAFWIGLVIGAEGVLAMLVPFWVGALSDQLPEHVARRFGRRILFLWIGAPLLAGAIALTPFMRGFWPLAAIGFLAFSGIHVYGTPLLALTVEGVDDRRLGRVHGTRAALRAGGLAYGLVASGLLFAAWPPLPFLVVAALVLLTTGFTAWAGRPGDRARSDRSRGLEWKRLWQELRHNRAGVQLLAANAFWNGAVDGIRPYIFLFASIVLGLTIAETSLVLVILIAGVGAGSLVVGYLADRTDRARVLALGVAFLAVALSAGFLARDLITATVILFAGGLGAAAIVALPYPVFAALVGNEHTGKYTGLFILSMSAGRFLAPVLLGGIIDLGARWLPEEQGYPLMWPAAGALAGVGWLLLTRARKRMSNAV